MKRGLVILLLGVFVMSMFAAITWGAPGMSGDPFNGTTDEEGLSNSIYPPPPPPPPPPKHEGYGYDAVRGRLADRFAGHEDAIRDPWDPVIMSSVSLTTLVVWKLIESCIGFPMPLTWWP